MATRDRDSDGDAGMDSHSRGMGAETAVDRGASDTEGDSERDGRPAWCGRMTICAIVY